MTFSSAAFTCPIPRRYPAGEITRYPEVNQTSLVVLNTYCAGPERQHSSSASIYRDKSTIAFHQSADITLSRISGRRCSNHSPWTIWSNGTSNAWGHCSGRILPSPLRCICVENDSLEIYGSGRKSSSAFPIDAYFRSTRLIAHEYSQPAGTDSNMFLSPTRRASSRDGET